MLLINLRKCIYTAIFGQKIDLSEMHFNNPDSKVHGANMGPIWGRQDPGGPHVGPMNLAIWGCNN